MSKSPDRLHPSQQTSPRAVRLPIKEFSESSTATGLLIFTVVISIHLLVLLFGISTESLLLKGLLGLVGGVTTGVLFVVGHDAAHGSLVRGKRLNRLLATLSFLPSLHPVCSWEIGHNKLHHGWTNLKGKDDVYVPLTVEEYAALTAGKKLLQRVYRSPVGFGLFYLVDIWLKSQILCLPAAYDDAVSRRQKLTDFAAVALWLVLTVVACSYWTDPAGAAWNVLLCLVLPFVVWNYVMTFVTFQQHTHPTVRWFDRREEWSFFEAQVGNTLHIRFPAVVDFLFARIFHHAAHHVDKTIPLYRLQKAQKALEASYPNVKVIAFSVPSFLETLKTCQLYDYRRHAWLPFTANAGVGETSNELTRTV